MKKSGLVSLVLVVSFAVCGGGFLFSQEAPVLTYEQQEQFDSQKLTITGYKIVTVSKYGVSDPGFGPDSKTWEVSKGYDKIDEPEFLQILGLDKEALQSRSHQNTRSSLTVGGTIVGVVGLGLILFPLIAPPTTTDSYGYKMTDVNASLAIMGAGLVVCGGGGLLIMMGEGMPPNITPYGRAKALADKYNLQLLIKITGHDPSRENKGLPDNGSV